MQQHGDVASPPATASSEPRLLVEGACSCSKDVVVAGRSVVDQLDQFNSRFQALQQHANSASSALLSDNERCTQWVGALVGVKSIGVLQASTNMGNTRNVALDVEAGLAYVAALDSDSQAIVDVGTDPTNPTLLGVQQNSTKVDGAYNIALDVDTGLACVVGRVSDGRGHRGWARTRPIPHWWACSKTPPIWTTPEAWC